MYIIIIILFGHFVVHILQKDKIKLMEARSPQETNRLLVKGTPHVFTDLVFERISSTATFYHLYVLAYLGVL